MADNLLAPKLDSIVGIVGLGIMGAGIVEVFASRGYSVVAVAESAQAVSIGQQNLAKSINRAIERGKLTAQSAKDIEQNISWNPELSELANCDLVIEAAPELLDLKLEIFSKLSQITKPTCILATNTSSLSVTQIAEATSRPENVVGFHFFNPAPVQKFIELIFTGYSSSEVINEAFAIGRSLDKYVAQVADQPGFIVNKLLLVYLNHAVQILDSGIATKLDIDSAMRELAQYPMGPLELVDLIGIDTCVEILKTIYQDSGNELHKPAEGLTKLLLEGHKGRKSGSGFYDYTTKPMPPTSDKDEIKSAVFIELETALLGNAVAMEASGYASKIDIDNGMKLGCGLPQGPFERIDQIGLKTLRERQINLATSTGNPHFAPLPL